MEFIVTSYKYHRKSPCKAQNLTVRDCFDETTIKTAHFYFYDKENTLLVAACSYVQFKCALFKRGQVKPKKV